MTMKLCVFPNDSLLSYFNKGEIKDKYFNPQNMFDEIHVISLFNEEISETKIQKIAGSAILKIHNIGKISYFNQRQILSKIEKVISEINPSVIRAYNPLLEGWCATKMALKFSIPLVVSLHTNYDQQRKQAKTEKKIGQFLKLWYLSKKIEKFIISNSNVVICSYNFLVPYAKKMGAKKIEVIYNKVNLENFSPKKKKEIDLDVPVIISVGRMIDQKDQSIIINAIQDLDVHLVLIGDGPNYKRLKKLIDVLKLQEKVTIFKSIPNEKLNGYYTSAEIYAQPMNNLGGITIPTLEAMASGLPIVMSRREGNDKEIIDDAVIFVENTPESFRSAFIKILNDPDLKNKLIFKSLSLVKKIDESIMEKNESELYRKLVV